MLTRIWSEGRTSYVSLFPLKSSPIIEIMKKNYCPYNNDEIQKITKTIDDSSISKYQKINLTCILESYLFI